MLNLKFEHWLVEKEMRPQILTQLGQMQDRDPRLFQMRH